MTAKRRRRARATRLTREAVAAVEAARQARIQGDGEEAEEHQARAETLQARLAALYETGVSASQALARDDNAERGDGR